MKISRCPMCGSKRIEVKEVAIQLKGRELQTVSAEVCSQ